MNYKQLKTYFEKEGNYSMLPKNGSLHRWCKTQRQEYKKGKLSQERIDLLKKLNFVWDPFDYQWNESYQKLKLYFENKGHSFVAVRDGSLGTWCSNQRKAYKTGKLSQEKIDLLEKIEFSWTL